MLTDKNTHSPRCASYQKYVIILYRFSLVEVLIDGELCVCECVCACVHVLKRDTQES